jgi:DNA-binding winged helix-turn-helix (wHTH) protein/Tol biopolymer transport system component
MGLSPPKTKIARFGLFEADFEQSVLTKAGVRVRLQEQPFQVLEMMLERPGELVTRTEIGQRLWSGNTFVEFDDGLNTAIRKLRSALGDDSDNPRFIETVPRKGYRFIAPVTRDIPDSPTLTPLAEAQNPQFGSVPPQEFLGPPQLKSRKMSLGRASLLAVLTVILCAACVVLAVWHWRTPSATPHLVRITQLTHSGSIHTNQNLVTDGVRLFYIERSNGEWTLKSMPSAGGLGTKLEVPLPRYDLQDVSPDRSELLLRLISSDGDNFSLWIMPAVGGPVHRVGDIHADAATYSPDGQSITYSGGSRVFMCDKNGQTGRQMIAVKGDVLRLRWSPTGDVLRFTLNDESMHTNSLWEIRPDGSGLHELLPGWNLPKWEWMLGWSHDARWFAFSAGHDGGRDIWMLLHDPLSNHADQGPFQLTAGPIEFDLPVFSADSKRLYAVGTQRRGELLRFNPKTGAFDPYLGAMSADQLDFSRNGQWVTYVTYPEGVLWRSRIDGSDPLKLNDTSSRILGPKWSPDGKQIAFLARTSSKRKWQAYLVSANGGLSRQIATSTEETNGVGWIDNGKTLVLSSPEWNDLRTMDVESGKIGTLPGSAHLKGVLTSPSGRFVICATEDDQQTELLDLKTGTRRPFARGANYPSFSKDERYIYMNRFDSSKPALYRVRTTDLKEEKLFVLTAFPAGGSWSTWTTVAPDGSILVLRDLGGADLYAIDWQPN